MEKTRAKWFTHIGEIRYENQRAGYHFFSPDTMRFFGSRVLPTVYGGRYFITVEDDFSGTKRLYTIREAQADGSVDTVGEFQAYETRAQAVKAVQAILKTGGNK
jgi:hypothetical protein